MTEANAEYLFRQRETFAEGEHLLFHVSLLYEPPLRPSWNQFLMC